MDQRDKRSRRSSAYRGSDLAQGQRGRHGAEIQKGDESGIAEGISGAGRIPVGRQLLGGWILFRVGGASERRNC